MYTVRQKTKLEKFCFEDTIKLHCLIYIWLT